MGLKNVTLFLDPALSSLNYGDDIHDYPLMQHPAQPAAIVALYFVFVFSLGPKLMKNRQAFGLRKIMTIYNIAQILFNLVVFVMAAKVIQNFSLYCSPPNNSNTPLDISVRKIHYYYGVLKFLDLLDTIFFVLRKKPQQITYMHVHHHVGMAVTTWATAKYFPGGATGFIFFYNTLVHALMYGYYLMSSWNSAKAIWWKKYLTQIQIVQQLFYDTMFTIHLFNANCNYSKGWLMFYLCNTFLMTYFFSAFYKKNYMSKKQVSDRKIE
ncbi:unnamed protein product [Tenebrio molitor]|nr:unnamed protein product [Tenebrio molitor]